MGTLLSMIICKFVLPPATQIKKDTVIYTLTVSRLFVSYQRSYLSSSFAKFLKLS